MCLQTIKVVEKRTFLEFVDVSEDAEEHQFFMCRAKTEPAPQYKIMDISAFVPAQMTKITLKSAVACGKAMCNTVSNASTEDDCLDYGIEMYAAELDKLEEAHSCRDVFESIAENVWSLVSTSEGSHLLQRAFDLANTSEQCLLAEKFQGRVLEAALSHTMNHVLQKCIKNLPSPKSQFIIDELRGHASEVAQTRCGCRVFERLLEHCPLAQVACLVDEVLSQPLVHCEDNYANFVIKSILQHGSVEHLARLTSAIASDIHRLSKHRVANHVVRCALMQGEPSSREVLLAALRADAKALSKMKNHPSGSFVYRAMRHCDHH